MVVPCIRRWFTQWVVRCYNHITNYLMLCLNKTATVVSVINKPFRSTDESFRVAARKKLIECQVNCLNGVFTSYYMGAIAIFTREKRFQDVSCSRPGRQVISDTWCRLNWPYLNNNDEVQVCRLNLALTLRGSAKTIWPYLTCRWVTPTRYKWDLM